VEKNAVETKTVETKTVEAKTVEAKTGAPTAAEKDVRARAKESYERFVTKLTDELKEATKVGKKQWEDAVKTTRDYLAKAKPPIKREDLEKLGDTVKKDVRHALRSFKTRGEQWTSSESFLTARDKGAQFLLTLAHRIKDAAETVEGNLEETLKYKKGELVSGGRFVCMACSAELKLEESGAIPSCPKCGKDDWKRKA
jgi:rubrerythrin